MKWVCYCMEWHVSFRLICWLKSILCCLYSFFNQQSEIDTHLNVLHIDLNTNYDTATNIFDALSTMMSTYSRSSWHFTSPTGVKPDLHHALLSKNLGGGIAYVGVICSSTYGFGLSASLSGSYRSMGNSVVWDMNVVSLLVWWMKLQTFVCVFYICSQHYLCTHCLPCSSCMSLGTTSILITLIAILL